MIEATGACNGIEIYSRYLTGRKPGEPPPTLFEYLPDNAIVFTDESHVTVPQIGGMYKGDFRRKATWPSTASACPPASTTARCGSRSGTPCARNRIHVSATPAKWEMEQTGGVFAEQVIRPTGLVDPVIECARPRSRWTTCWARCREVAQAGYRTLVTTLTKRMART